MIVFRKVTPFAADVTLFSERYATLPKKKFPIFATPHRSVINKSFIFLMSLTVPDLITTLVWYQEQLQELYMSTIKSHKYVYIINGQ